MTPAARIRPALVLAALAGAVALTASAGSSAAPGDLDPTFGDDGVVVTQTKIDEWPLAVTLQRDGKIVAAGQIGPNIVPTEIIPRFGVFRYLPNGAIDTTFGDNGRTQTFVGYGYSAASAIAVQPDGRIVAAGYADYDFALVRYRPSGSLDKTFGNDGKAVTAVPGFDFSGASAIALQPDGKVVAAGWAWAPNDGRVALARYRPDGSLDDSLGEGGVVAAAMPSDSRDGGYAVAIQKDGKIVVAGGSFEDGRGYFAVFRYLPNGSLDKKFDDGGRTRTSFWDRARATGVAIQPDGRIVAVGYTSKGSPTTDQAFALARYRPDGSLDTTFGQGGKVVTRFTDTFDGGWAVALQKDGKIVVGGWADIPGLDPQDTDLAVARYTAGGSLDKSFGHGGKVTTPKGNIWGLAIQSDGKIVGVGEREWGNVYDPDYHTDVEIVRYLAAPAPLISSLRPTSGPTGRTLWLTGAHLNGANAVSVGGRPADFTVTSETSITAKVPDGVSTGTVEVETPGGRAKSPFDYSVTFSVTGFAPASGSAGTVVTVDGIGFSGRSRVSFAGMYAQTTYVSPTRLRAVVPAGAKSGPILVTNVALDGGTVRSAGSFTST